MRSSPCSTLGLERTNGVLIWSNNMTSWSLSPVSSRLPCKRQNNSHLNLTMKVLLHCHWILIQRFEFLPCPQKSLRWLHPEWFPWCSGPALLWRLLHCPYSLVLPLEPEVKQKSCWIFTLLPTNQTTQHNVTLSVEHSPGLEFPAWRWACSFLVWPTAVGWSSPSHNNWTASAKPEKDTYTLVNYAALAFL